MAEIERWLPKEVRDSAEYRIACTHSSVGQPNNERLEFLGDALLGLIISEHLHQRFPDLAEGDLTRLRSHLVCRSMLGKLAARAQLGDALILNVPNLQARARRTIEGNALEAVIAAVYQVSGLEETCKFVAQLYGKTLQDLPSPESLRSAKTSLQEFLQARGFARARYTLLREMPTQSPRFEVLCEAKDLGVKARGKGDRVRDAEQEAAAAVLSTLRQQQPGGAK